MISPFFGEFFVTQKFNSRHNGLDLYSGQDTTVHAVSDGRVIFVGRMTNGLGLAVVIEGADNRVWYYAHLATATVVQYQYVKLGEAIGVQGSTGNSQAPHLHLACVGKNGYENPSALLSISSHDIGEPLYYTPVLRVPAIVLNQSPKQIKATITLNGTEYEGTLRPKKGGV